MVLKTVQFVALVLVALALIPAGAHLFELPNKIRLAQDQYFAVQSIYRGWALFGFVLLPAVAVLLLLAIVSWGQGVSFWLAVLAFLCVVANLAMFFTWTYPANVATENWTVVPANWERLRVQWEYSHAINAVFVFVAFCALALAVVMTRSRAAAT